VTFAFAACGRAPSEAIKDASVGGSDALASAPADASIGASSDAVSDAVSDAAIDAASEAADVGRDAAEAAKLDEGPLAGARYAPAKAFVTRYCAECHTERGAHAKKKRALPQQRLDTYEQWRSHASVLRGVIDKWHPDGKTMPIKGATAMPRDDERRAMLEWLERGSPNTDDGR
jgi:uncharacterized membrane protein